MRRKNNYSEAQKWAIEEALQEGVDIRKYVDDRFNPDQMYEVMMGLLEEVDVKKYADPALSAHTMYERRNHMALYGNDDTAGLAFL